MLLYLEKGNWVIDMKISGKTVIYMMRIVGSIIILAAFALIGYLAWITSNVGLDGFLISGFGVGIISLAVAGLMIYFSFRIMFEEDVDEAIETVEMKEKKHIHFRKCG